MGTYSKIETTLSEIEELRDQAVELNKAAEETRSVAREKAEKELPLNALQALKEVGPVALIHPAVAKQVRIAHMYPFSKEEARSALWQCAKSIFTPNRDSLYVERGMLTLKITPADTLPDEFPDIFRALKATDRRFRVEFTNSLDEDQPVVILCAPSIYTMDSTPADYMVRVNPSAASNTVYIYPTYEEAMFKVTEVLSKS